jgi:DNA-binding NarL/FixJ family response regulator
MEHVIAEQLAFDNIYHVGLIPFEKLSYRLFQEIGSIISGKKINEIATRLSLSPEEVNEYRRQLLEDLNISNDDELQLLANSFELPAMSGNIL